MVLTGKNIKYIIIVAIAVVVIYYLFFKKNAVSAEKAVTGKKVGETVETPTKPAEATPPPAEPVSPLEIDPAEEAKKETLETRYIGPQDCAENCGGHYDRRKVKCYDKLDYKSCLDKAKITKQMCVSKCDQTMPRYMNTEQIVNTPLQEDNYEGLFNNLFKQGYV